MTSLGYNLDAGTTCALAGTGDISGSLAALGVLVYNGGATQMKTHALLPGSPALNSGDNGSCPSTDQRGFPRPVGVCDMGAYESQ